MYEKLKRKMLTSTMQQSIMHQQQDDASLSTRGNIGNIHQPMPMTPRPPIPSNQFEPAHAYTHATTANTPVHSIRYPEHGQSAPFVPFERPLAPSTLEPTHFQPRVPHRPHSTLPRPFIPNTPMV